MRHNKMAGNSKFLLGKSIPSKELLASRKRKPSTFTSSGSFADCKRKASQENLLHSKSTYFYRWGSIVPSVCAVALLLGMRIMINPAISSTSGSVYAADTNDDQCKTTEDTNTGICAMELGLLMNGTDSTFNEAPATELSTDSVVHRDYSFSVRAVDTKDGYNLYAGVVNTGAFGNSLVNADYPTEEYMIKAINGSNVAYSSIGSNEWGYAIATEDTYTTPAEELMYNALPITSITTENNQTILTSGKLIDHGTDTGYDPSRPVGEDIHEDRNYKMYFAAKASPDAPSGHYRTQVMLSLVANPKSVSTMQTFTTAACNALTDPIQIRDMRDGTKYWVSKLKDGKCWMTQNLDLALTAGMELSSADTDILDASGKYTTPTDLGNYKDPGMINYKTTAASAAYASSGCGDPATSGCNAYFETYTNTVGSDEKSHYLIGNYYPWPIATTGKMTENQGSICPKGWKLPTKSEYDTLINGIANTNATTNTIRTSPYYFVPAGIYSSSYSNVSKEGDYWSSTPMFSTAVYVFTFDSGSLGLWDNYNNRTNGRPVRCVLK